MDKNTYMVLRLVNDPSFCAAALPRVFELRDDLPPRFFGALVGMNSFASDFRYRSVSHSALQCNTDTNTQRTNHEKTGRWGRRDVHQGAVALLHLLELLLSFAFFDLPYTQLKRKIGGHRFQDETCLVLNEPL